MSYLALSGSPFHHFKVGEYAGRALQERSYSRYVARAKPPLSLQNRHNRLVLAREHVNWTKEQWCQTL
jgi:hypothetical protein